MMTPPPCLVRSALTLITYPNGVTWLFGSNHEDITIMVLLDNRQPYKRKVFQGYMQKLGLGGGGKINYFKI